MIQIPYIKVNQRGETFFVTKMKASLLKEHVNFHFRDPYLEYQNEVNVQKFEAYIEKLGKKGISIEPSENGIQRRLDFKRINDIQKFVESNSSNFFPNSILVSVDVTDIYMFEDKFSDYELNEFGEFELPDSINFTVIDGQHRLAGLFLCDQNTIDDFELVVIMLINISLSTAAKLFSDINGKQKSVSKSLLYDLSEDINPIEFSKIRTYHTIASKFYTDEKSPLYRQIKMLGIGRGAISQSFFIEYAIASVKKTNLDNAPVQEIYNQLFYYFKAFQMVFPEDWPVPSSFVDYNDLDNHAQLVLKEKNSQLVKTNGFGAIMTLFPYVYKNSNGTYRSYLDIISKLEGRISWVPDKTDPQGTGKKFQNFLFKQMKSILFENCDFN
ncbi:DGQHR domain-containing protein [Methanolobus sp. WCC5]|uniref:DGQHR domain-containing protein n=1 Tax=Methanolobus sp. WCC5 TaxID=3125785 RepID=UPI003248DACB